MKSIIKTLLALTTASGLATGLVVVKKHPEIFGLQRAVAVVSPIIIHKDLTVSFLQRIPPANVAADIRKAVRNENPVELNEQLVKYRLFVVPESDSGKF